MAQTQTSKDISQIVSHRVSHDLTVNITASRQWMNYSHTKYGLVSFWGGVKLQTISIPWVTQIKQ